MLEFGDMVSNKSHLLFSLLVLGLNFWRNIGVTDASADVSTNGSSASVTEVMETDMNRISDLHLLHIYSFGYPSVEFTVPLVNKIFLKDVRLRLVVHTSFASRVSMKPFSRFAMFRLVLPVPIHVT